MLLYKTISPVYLRNIENVQLSTNLWFLIIPLDGDAELRTALQRVTEDKLIVLMISF